MTEQINFLVTNIYEEIKDYRNHDGIFITPDKILEWAAQFEDDAELVLTELNKMMPEIYVSRNKAKNYIEQHLENYLKLYKYSNISSFLMDTEFLNMQMDHKSQPAILVLLAEVLTEKYNESYENYVSYPKLNYIYIDDVLASGSTIGKHCIDFLNRKDDAGMEFHKKLENSEIKFSVCVFCLHRWGFSFQNYRISKTFNEKVAKKINWLWNYEIENHSKFNNQRFNVAKPIKGDNVRINTYLENLSASKYDDYAYREINTPRNETFFTTAESRIKFENILTEKGIDIIEMINGEIKSNLRPLGLINPQYKIFGLGTHFFTWRNVPNNSPLVYWWEIADHAWTPLFSVANRG